MKQFLAKHQQSAEAKSAAGSAEATVNWLLLLPHQLANTIQSSDQRSTCPPISEHLAHTIKSCLKSFIVNIADDKTYRQSLADTIENSECYRSLLRQPDKVSPTNIVFYKDCPEVGVKDTEVHRLPAALSHVAAAKPARFQVLFCSAHTSLSEVSRFQQCMKTFPNAEYFIIGFEHLPDALKAVLMGPLKCHSGTSSLTILTAKSNAVAALLPEIAHETLKELRSYSRTACTDDNHYAVTQFVIGESGAGKSHYISSINPSPLYLGNSGDAITIEDVAAFVRSAAINTLAGHADHIDVWINIDQNVLKSTTSIQKADGKETMLQSGGGSSKLLELNKVLWMLLVSRIIETPEGEVIPVPHQVRFLVEVAPFVNSFYFSDPECDSKQDIGMGLRYLPFAYAGLSNYNVVTRKGGKDELMESLHSNQDTPFRARVLFAARAIRMIYTKFEETKPVKEISEAFDIFDKAMGAEGRIAPDDGKAAFTLLPANLYSHCGKFCALVDSLKHNTLFSIDPERLAYVKKKNSAALNMAAALIVKGVVDRWSENCVASLKKLGQYGTLLFINHQFIPYPLSSFPEGDAIRTTFAPFRESLVKAMRQRVPLSGEDTPSIANVIIGNCFECDVKDVIAVWSDLGITPDVDEDIIIKFMCCTERQQTRMPLIVEGTTHVGKGSLIDALFSVQIRRAQRKAMEALDAFKLAQIQAAGKTVNGSDPEDINAKFATIFLEGLLAGTLPHAWNCALDELKKTPVLNYPAIPAELAKATPLEKYDDAQAIVAYFEGISLKETSFKMVIHSDSTEEEILKFLVAPTQLAQALCSDTSACYVRDHIVPVFFDDLNATARCAGLLKSLLIDRRNPRTGLCYSEKLWFVGATKPDGGPTATQITHPAFGPHQCQFVSIDAQQEKTI